MISKNAVVLTLGQDFPKELADLIRANWPEGTVRAELSCLWYDGEGFSELPTHYFSDMGIELYHDFDINADDYWHKIAQADIASQSFLDWIDKMRRIFSYQYFRKLNVLRVVITADGEPEVDWFNDPDLVNNYFDSMRGEQGEEAYQDYIRERDKYTSFEESRRKVLECINIAKYHLIDAVRLAAPEGAVRSEFYCLFYEFGPESSWGGISASGDYLPFPDGAFGEQGCVQSAAVSTLIEWLSTTRSDVAARHDGQMPNVLKGLIPAQSEDAQFTWIVDNQLDAEWFEQYRQDMGEEAYQELMQALEEERLSKLLKPQESQESSAPTGPEPEPVSSRPLSAGELLGHIVAEVSDSAPSGWSEWVMDAGVSATEKDHRNHTHLDATYWVRIGTESIFKRFIVQNVVGPLNAVQDLQTQLLTPTGKRWDSIRIRYRQGAESTDISFDPQSPPEGAVG